MNRRWSDDATYNFVGRVIGFGLAPLSVTGIGVPLYLRLPENTKRWIGFFYLGICILILLCNLYLICRRKSIGRGSSMFPVVFTLSATPAFFLLAPPVGYWSVAVVVVILVADFIGQPLLGGFLCKVFGLNRLDIDPKCF